VLHVGLDLSRRRVDVCLISSEGELVEHFRAPADRDGLYGLSRRVAVYDEPVRGVVESMNGARFVHDELVRYGWEVLVADAQRVKGLAPLACKTDKIDARVLAELSFRDLVPAIWLPTPELRAERERSRWRLHLVKHRSILKNRVHASLTRVRPSGPDGGPVRSRWPPAARRAGFPGAVAWSRPGER
jgi:transposase